MQFLWSSSAATGYSSSSICVDGRHRWLQRLCSAVRWTLDKTFMSSPSTTVTSAVTFSSNKLRPRTRPTLSRTTYENGSLDLENYSALSKRCPRHRLSSNRSTSAAVTTYELIVVQTLTLTVIFPNSGANVKCKYVYQEKIHMKTTTGLTIFECFCSFVSMHVDDFF